MSTSKKIVFAALISLLSVIVFCGALELAARLYGGFFDTEDLYSEYDPDISTPKIVPASLNYKLASDLKYQKETGYSSAPTHFPSLIFKMNEVPSIGGARQLFIQANTKDGKLAYNTVYSFDDYARRITVHDPATIQYKYHLLFAGCSFTFGEGLSDRETLPSQFAEINKKFHVYNLGVRGGSIADHIRDIQKRTLWDDIKPDKGLLIISFNAMIHMERFMGTVKHVGTADIDHVTSYVARNASTGRYEYQGTIKEKQRIWYSFSRFVMSSYLLRRLKFDMPSIANSDFANYAKAISDLIHYYQTKYPGSRALVYLGPMDPASKNIIPYLEQLKIFYFDYSDFDLNLHANKPTKIQYDGHPTSEYNRIMAEQINHDLQLEKNKDFLED